MSSSPARKPFYWIYLAVIGGIVFVFVAALSYGLKSFKESVVYYQLKPTFPGTSPVWDVGPMINIYLNVENTVHYQLNSSRADAEWGALVPEDGGIVHVGPDRRPFMLSVFHQLRCLNIIRQAYVVDAHNSLPEHAKLAGQSRHCLNYLRQMIMCRANLRLEPVVDPFGVHPVNPWGKLTCSDWRAVYRAFDANRADYIGWSKTSPS
ncbi:hypothetical protein C8R46DRAFT_490513 [Mycena filopes]|nr:hypothetical protein C8R46DRAFT_490513 [Mycena filopes]